ncbi:MAG: hypothetical protein PVJ09_00880 [Candidatus Woesebacteria bacterium]|jgi:hypothetical protein
MRRREKFVIFSILLSIGLLAVQYISLDWRYLAIAIFMIISYLASAWALSDDLQRYECLTILPMPAMYAGSVALFYFLLPGNILSKFFILSIFGVGIYALFLTSNIYSVAKGRTIQLLYAAHAVGLLFTLLTSLLFTNSIFSLRLPFYFNIILMALVHAPLIFMSLWSINLESTINKELLAYTVLLTFLIVELTTILSLLPFPVWYSSLFMMGFLYIALGILHSFLRGRLFRNTTQEYFLVAIFIAFLFLLLFPLK